MINTKEISFEESLIQLRFIGEELESKSVPIYDLGVSLIAVQRMLHKAYLAQLGFLGESSLLSKNQRLELSLQIGARKNASDGYGLIPLFSDPAVIKSIETILPIVFSALGQYILKRMETNKDKPDKNQSQDSTNNRQFDEQLFAGNIYAEVVQVAERIENNGVIKNIELSTNRKVESRKLVINADIKKYLKSLKDQQVFGKFQDISGTVKTIDEANNIVEVNVPVRRTIKVHLNDKDFEIVRYEAKRHATIMFSGYPILLIGQNRYKAFEAHSVKILK